MDLFLNPAIFYSKKGLDAGALRQRVIANNIANVNTPHFKKSAVVFESLLKNALGEQTINMRTTSPAHFASTASQNGMEPQVKQIETTTMRTDGNNVDIDEEMVNLASNGILYQATARQLNDQYSILSYVITGGRK